VLRADDAEARRWVAAIAHADAIGIDRWRIPPGASLSGALAAQVHSPGGVAHLCRGAACLPPITTPDDLLTRLA
jgi:hypothetical protein